jgi:hypothetical protein
MSLTLKFYTQMKYGGRNMCDFFRFFVNFVSLCARYVHMILFLLNDIRSDTA